MTKDLEETLAELGPGYRAVVDRVVEAYQSPSPATPPVHIRRGTLVGWTTAYLVAASLLVFVGLAVLFDGARTSGVSESQMVYTVAYAPNEAALQTIRASQHPDGSWSNDFITRQNAAALRTASDTDSRIAYKKAVRYLKSRGLKPLSDAELKARSDEAARLVGKT